MLPTYFNKKKGPVPPPSQKEGATKKATEPPLERKKATQPIERLKSRDELNHHVQSILWNHKDERVRKAVRYFGACNTGSDEYKIIQALVHVILSGSGPVLNEMNEKETKQQADESNGEEVDVESIVVEEEEEEEEEDSAGECVGFEGESEEEEEEEENEEDKAFIDDDSLSSDDEAFRAKRRNLGHRIEEEEEEEEEEEA